MEIPELPPRPDKVDDRIPYVIVRVEDVQRSVDFYHRKLGLPLREHKQAAAMGGQALAIQGTTLILLDKGSAARYLTASATANLADAGTCHPTFAVSDLDSFHAVAVAAGVDCVQPPRVEPFGSVAVYRDPDGLFFSVVSITREPGRRAVVLSGGGALGAFELGVLSQLASNGEPDPDVFTGTSVGGFNAAVLACSFATKPSLRHAADSLIKIWRKQVAGGLRDNGVFRIRGDAGRLLYPGAMMRGPTDTLQELLSDAAFVSLDFSRRLANLAMSSNPFGRRLMEMIDISTLLSTEPLRRLVAESVSYEQLCASRRVLKLATTDWITGRLSLFVHDPDPVRLSASGDDSVVMTESDFTSAVLASTAIPGLFPPISIPVPGTPQGKPFVDGGVVMNTPLNPAIEAGADVIHLICLNPDTSTLPLGPISNSMDAFQRLLVAAAAGHVASDLSRARFVNSVAGVARHKRTGKLYRPVTIHRYHPPRDNLGGVIGMLDFSLEHIDALIQDGLKCVRQHNCMESGCVVPAEHDTSERSS